MVFEMLMEERTRYERNKNRRKEEFTADYYVDMKELIREFQPSVEMTTGNEEKTIWEWSMTEEMERLLE